MTHNPECIWQQTTPEQCDYRATRSFCPHIEHSCTCKAIDELKAVMAKQKDDSTSNNNPKIPDDAWVRSLISGIKSCRDENQGQRFGQLLYNLIAKKDLRGGELDPSYQEDFHTRLFYIEDEELTQMIQDYSKTGNL